MSEITTYNSKSREIVGWLVDGCDDEVVANDIEDAIYKAFDGEYSVDLPDTCAVKGYVKRELPATYKIADRILEHIYAELNEEYGGDESFGYIPEEPTEDVIEAANHLADTIRRDYTPWQCEESDVVVQVELKDYID